MEFKDKIKQLSSNVEKQIPHIQTEEATKNAFVMPFMAALGYDVFNPLEVVPEFIADVGTKKGEKVDYAIKKDGKVVILIECKHHKDSLSLEKSSQLYRYFSVTESRFGIITNGVIYRFYSDLEHPNKMDDKPFFEFDIRKYEEAQIAELQKFAKEAFDLDKILNTANDLKYVGAVRKILENDFQNPSEEFIRYCASQVYEGRLTKSAFEQFSSIVRKATSQFITEKVSDKLKSALESTKGQEPQSDVENQKNDDEIVTTQEELDGFHIVKAIGCEIVAVNRIVMRDTKSYCGIILDDNNRKPVCRLHMDRSKKYIGLFDKDKNEERHEINSVDDIYKFSKKIKATIKYYLEAPTEEVAAVAA